jgi:hypothetical protein
LTLTRSRQPAQPNSEVPIVIRVKNEDDYRRDADKVTVTDELPEGFDLVWQSAKVSQGAVTITGTNPYTFTLDKLVYQGTVELTYHMLPRPKRP